MREHHLFWDCNISTHLTQSLKQSNVPTRIFSTQLLIWWTNHDLPLRVQKTIDPRQAPAGAWTRPKHSAGHPPALAEETGPAPSGATLLEGKQHCGNSAGTCAFDADDEDWWLMIDDWWLMMTAIVVTIMPVGPPTSQHSCKCRAIVSNAVLAADRILKVGTKVKTSGMWFQATQKRRVQWQKTNNIWSKDTKPTPSLSPTRLHGAAHWAWVVSYAKMVPEYRRLRPPDFRFRFPKHWYGEKFSCKAPKWTI